MATQRSLLVLVLGLAAAAAAALAQMPGAFAWAGAGNGYYGLQPGRSDFKVHCGTIAFPCGVHVPLLEKKPALGSELRFYGRLGPAVPRPATHVLGAPPAETSSGLSFGVAVSWELSPRASASIGWNSQEWRSGSTDREPVRSTSLGLQWRY